VFVAALQHRRYDAFAKYIIGKICINRMWHNGVVERVWRALLLV